MKAIIIGAGIGGLTTGIALKQVGIQTEIFEATPEISVAGAGIWMATNAMQVFDRLGMAKDVLNAGIALEKLSITDHRLRKIQDTEQAPYVKQFGYSITSILRSRLRDVLLQHYSGEVQLGKRVQEVIQTEEQVQATFEDGSTAMGDLLIGADGIHSAVRTYVYPQAQLRYSGQTCWRGVANLSLPPELGNCCIETWGKHYRFGLSVISESEVYWFAVAKAPLGETEPVAKRKEKITQMFADFAQPIPDIIASTPADQIIRNDISDLKPLPYWHKGRISLIGDAAHATTPNMGQGGGQAVEDAWFLAQMLSQHSDPERAFATFRTKRQAKVRHVVSNSWRIGKLAHFPYAQGLRNALLRQTPPKRIEKMMMELYSLEY